MEPRSILTWAARGLRGASAERFEITQPISENQIEVLGLGITNRAFAIELFLKAFLLTEGKEEEGHRLDKLFEEVELRKSKENY